MIGPAAATRQPEPRRESSPPAQHDLLVFHLGDQAYALALREVREVVPMALLSRPPTLPAVLEGFLNVGGTAVPVLRLGRLFRLPDQAVGLYTPLLILRHPDSHLALLVDRLGGIIHATAEQVLPVHGHSLNDCAEAVVSHSGHVIPLLSGERILSEKEQQCLAELQDREQARLRDLEGAGA